MSVATRDDHASKMIAAAELIRSGGYVIVTATEREMWDRWLREAHQRDRITHDQNQRLIWAVGELQDEIKELLKGGRPAWWRRHLAWWKSYGYTEPLVFGPRGET